jgi:hypothetical protein
LEMTATKTVTIKEFIPADQLDVVAIEKSYYLGPDKGGDKGYCSQKSCRAKARSQSRSGAPKVVSTCAAFAPTMAGCCSRSCTTPRRSATSRKSKSSPSR